MILAFLLILANEVSFVKSYCEPWFVPKAEDMSYWGLKVGDRKVGKDPSCPYEGSFLSWAKGRVNTTADPPRGEASITVMPPWA